MLGKFILSDDWRGSLCHASLSRASAIVPIGWDLTSEETAMDLPPPPAGYEQRMRRFSEEPYLRTAGQDQFRRNMQLAEEAADAWAVMRRASEEEGIHLLLLSGFRSLDRQAEIVRRKLLSGQSLEDILTVSAYPGFSEHHTGRAIDFGSPDCEHFSEAFERTREYSWLCGNAARHGFRLSYPRSNASGIIYEPWHWSMVNPQFKD